MLWILLACAAEDRALLYVPVAAGPKALLQPAAAEEISLKGGVVRLESGSLTLADVRLEEAATATAWSFSLISAAYAHPGHDFAGATRGELLGEWTIDLVSPAVELGEAAVYEGRYATGRVALLAAALAGTYTPDGGEPLPFAFDLAFEDEELTGIPFEAAISADAPPAGITLALDPAAMAGLVDWSGGDIDGDGTLTLADGTLANSVPFGVASTSGYAFFLQD